MENAEMKIKYSRRNKKTDKYRRPIYFRRIYFCPICLCFYCCCFYLPSAKDKRGSYWGKNINGHYFNRGQK